MDFRKGPLPYPSSPFLWMGTFGPEDSDLLYGSYSEGLTLLN